MTGDLYPIYIKDKKDSEILKTHSKIDIGFEHLLKEDQDVNFQLLVLEPANIYSHSTIIDPNPLELQSPNKNFPYI